MNTFYKQSQHFLHNQCIKKLKLLKLRTFIYIIFILLDVEFKKQVLRQLQIIILKQSQMWEDIQTIVMTKQDDNTLTMNNNESIFNKFVFPLKTISDLNVVEDYLEDEGNAKMLVSIYRWLNVIIYFICRACYKLSLLIIFLF